MVLKEKKRQGKQSPMQSKEKLYEMLATLPNFTKLAKGWQENAQYGNRYIEHFLPSQTGTYYDQDETPPRPRPYVLSDTERLNLAQEILLSDNKGWFSEFVHDDMLREDVSEFMRDILRIIQEHHTTKDKVNETPSFKPRRL